MALFYVNSLSGKLLRIHLPLTVLAVLALFVVLEVDFYRGERARLIEGLDRLVNVHGTAIEAAVWEFDLQRVRNLLQEQSRLAFFEGAQVRGKAGEVLAAAGDVGAALRSPDFRVEHPLIHKSGSGAQQIGTLVVQVHDEGIRQALLGHLKINGAVLLVLVTALVAGTWYGVRVVIGRPLEEFRQAIERSREEAVQAPLTWERQDELGDVVQAYNEMLEARHRAEAATRQREGELREAARLARESSEEAARFNRLAIGRELRVVDLKKRVNLLSEELDRPPPFHIPEEAAFEEAVPGAETEGVEVEYALDNLLDLPELQSLFEDFCAIAEVPAAIIDLKAKVLASSRWQKACTDFHRVNAVTCARCIESDTQLALQLQEGQDFSIYRCKNGLTDAASPIVVNGRHLANVFIGQFLLQPPDLAFFRAQALEVGFDPEAYLQSITALPVMQQEKLPVILDFLSRFAKLLATFSLERLLATGMEKAKRRGELAALNLAEDAEMARAQLAEYQKQLENLVEERTRDLRAAEARSRLILECAGEGIFGTDAGGRIHFINPAAQRMLGGSAEELIGQSVHATALHSRPDGTPYPVEECPMWRVYTRGESARVDDEFLWRRDGSGFPAEYAAVPIWQEETLAGSVVTFRDITERRQAEAAVREKMAELENFARVAVGRELRMIALKEEVNGLCATLNQPQPYEIVT
ncbi:MAG: PocR ligand-binding domain-containing protein [Magnetococcales bacterium]|nr:PocR ligand-binding domain-containing protein [Magnetococcales bacterium]